jgi:hypothetical protein
LSFVLLSEKLSPLVFQTIVNLPAILLALATPGVGRNTEVDVEILV